jgi:hypothetical protein
VPSKEQLARWPADWGRVKDVAGKKIDSVQFASGDAPRERVVIRCQDGTRLLIEAQPDGSIRAWLSCCGKPDGFAPGVNA